MLIVLLLLPRIKTSIRSIKLLILHPQLIVFLLMLTFFFWSGDLYNRSHFYSPLAQALPVLVVIRVRVIVVRVIVIIVIIVAKY